jgi:diphthamide synthase (EF-2-diphthine--ammonia ligase)
LLAIKFAAQWPDLACNSLDTMPTSAKALIAWSSGKDSAWALHETRGTGDFEIVGALTMVTDTFRRVSMHGVREELLCAQLDAAVCARLSFIFRIRARMTSTSAK